jgi:pSer/pThr/pTyr-binding forkhead associated (FHA) protein
MRIEILVGAEDPIIYSLKEPKMTIGSAETNDVILTSSGVSRKHLLITTDGEKFFVSDQGSTNGSYINEERLVPGRRVEFTSFFPVRLGDDVLVSLLSDEEGMFSGPEEIKKKKQEISPPPAESTRVISLQELKKAKTSKLIQKREQKRKVAKKAAKKKETKGKGTKSPLSFVSLLSLGIVAAATYITLNREPVEELDVTPPVVKVKEKKPEAPKVSYLVKPEDRTPPESFAQFLKGLKCTSDIEVYFCERIPETQGNELGVLQRGTMVNILLDGTSYMKEVRRVIKKFGTTEENMKAYEEHLKYVQTALFLQRGLPKDLDSKKLEDITLTFAFYEDSPEGLKYSHAAAVDGKGLLIFRGKLSQNFLRYVKTPTSYVTNLLREFIVVY